MLVQTWLGQRTKKTKEKEYFEETQRMPLLSDQLPRLRMDDADLFVCTHPEGKLTIHKDSVLMFFCHVSSSRTEELKTHLSS